MITSLSDTEKKTVESLSPEQLYYAYQLQDLKFRMEDARQHLFNILGGEFQVDIEECRDDPDVDWKLFDSFNKDDFRQMAEIFIENYDCNLDENSMWESVVKMAIKSKNVQEPKL